MVSPCIANSLRSLSILIIGAVMHSYSFAQIPIAGDSLLSLLENHPRADTTKVLLLNQLAFSNYYNNPVLAMRYGFEARRIADSLHFAKGEADAFRQIGLAFWAQADMPTAINYYLAGLRIAEVNQCRQVEADIIGNIGTAYNGLGNPQEALNFLNRALAMQQGLKNKWREASVLNNIGDSYLALKDFGKATEAYQRALRYSRERGYKLGITTNTRNLGNVFEQKGQYDSALANYQKCILLCAEIKDNRGYILSHKSVASVYLKAQKLKQAEQYATIGLDAASKANLRAIMRDLYELLAKIEEAKGDKTRAFVYFKLFAAYKDSVQNLRVVSDVAAHRLRFETEKKQTEIELLKKDKELQVALLSNKNSQLVLAIISLSLSILLLILAIQNYRRIKSKNKQLQDKNAEIEKQHLRLSEMNDELVALNEELQSQQEEVMMQRDELEIKNKEVESMNRKVIEVNDNLEKVVAERTSALEKQNEHLAEYAFFNAHKLRAPVASILGLVNLLHSSKSPEEKEELLHHLQLTTEKLDQVIRSVSSSLQQGMDVYREDRP